MINFKLSNKIERPSNVYIIYYVFLLPCSFNSPMLKSKMFWQSTIGSVKRWLELSGRLTILKVINSVYSLLVASAPKIMLLYNNV